MSTTLIRLSASAIVYREADERFLIIEEMVNDRVVLDVPGGTWEAGENLVETSIREAAEEASIQFVPQHYLGCFVTEYTSTRGQRVCSVRNAFAGVVGSQTPDIPRDLSTQAIYWMNLGELLYSRQRLRSSVPLRCVQAYLKGRLLPLDFCDQTIDF